MMATHKTKTKFNESFTVVLNQIRSLKLDWLKAGSLPDTQNASENYLCLARLWSFYTAFYEHHKEHNTFRGGQGGIDPHQLLCLRRLSNVYSAMISLLMRLEPVDAEDLDEHIKLFLSCVIDYERSLKGTNRYESIVFTKGNFLSMLNLSEQLLYLGQSRLIWEGNSEFYISKIKDDIDHVRQSYTFFERKLRKHQQRLAIKFLRNQMNKESGAKEWSAKRFHRYKSAEVITNALSSGTCLSILIHVSDNNIPTLYALFGRNRDNKRKLVRLNAIVDDNHQIQELCGLLYCQFRLHRNGNGDVMEIEKEEHELDQFLGGMLLSFGGSQHVGHCLISENWKTLDEKGRLTYPVVSKNIFAEDLKG